MDHLVVERQKAVEFYVMTTTIQRPINLWIWFSKQWWWYIEMVKNSPLTGTANAGDIIYLTANEADLVKPILVLLHDFVDNSANNNGDDALELFSGGVR